jgi:hypothetical protein
MRRLMLAGTASVAITFAATPSGSAQDAGARTITFFQDGSGATTKFIDAAPKSPTPKLISKRFRFSPGDVLIATAPALDSTGGTRIGTLYSRITIVVGGKLRASIASGDSVVNLRDGQIVVAGAARVGDASQPGAVTGGTGAYEGARGSAAATATDQGAETTIRLLP